MWVLRRWNPSAPRYNRILFQELISHYTFDQKQVQILAELRIDTDKIIMNLTKASVNWRMVHVSENWIKFEKRKLGKDQSLDDMTASLKTLNSQLIDAGR